MLINSKNGGVFLDNKTEIKPGMNKKEVLKKHPEWITDSLNISNGYSWIYYKNFKSEKTTFDLRLCFFENKFCGINLFIDDFEKEAKTIKPDWNKDHPKSQFNLLKYWLTNQVGTEREFNWGVIYEDFQGVYSKIKEFVPKGHFANRYPHKLKYN
ncbi:hypothetical protein GCM10022393_43510 [Aquimarina addita]|uniref:Uncharacterized protein n=1 Tax=Aquimarina addita TaxID=870485 RepID=A0ABP6UXN8_9FLAO